MTTPEAVITGVSVPEEEKQAVLQLPKDLDAAWDRRDVKAFADLFCEDGSFRFETGHWVIGRDNIEAFWEDQVFPRLSEGLRHESTPSRVHFVTDCVALGDGTLRIVDCSVDPPQVHLEVEGTLLVVRREGRWVISAVRLATLAKE